MNALEVVRIRKSLKLSRERFASVMGISIYTLDSWESGRRIPRGPDRKIMTIMKMGLLHPCTIELF